MSNGTGTQPQRTGRGPKPPTQTDPKAVGPADATTDAKVADPAAPTAKPKRVKEKPEGSDAYGRLPHPLVGNPDSTIYPFTAPPADFNIKIHQPLHKNDFKSEVTYCNYSAEILEVKAAKLRKRATRLEKIGGGEDAKTSLKMLKLKDQMAELRASLSAKGIDVDALLAANAEE